MDKSKLISLLIAKLKIAYPYYFKDLDDESLIGLISLYNENLSEYNEMTLKKAINSIIKNSKYMPTIKDIRDECEKNITYHKNFVIEKMIEDGYFESQKEINKIYMWLEENCLPGWFIEDMKNYGYETETALIETKIEEVKRIKQ